MTQHAEASRAVSGLVWNDILTDLPGTVTAETDPAGVGFFLGFAAPKPAARHVFPVGNLTRLSRFTCCHRYEPFWMRPMAGTRAGDVPAETQFLLAAREDGTFVLLVPLLDGAFRMALQGNGEDSLEVVAESGDPAVMTSAVTGLFVAEGSDPYTLLEASAKSVMAHLKTGRLRRDKPLPAFADKFGWCTWDAFYAEVSHDKVRQGLESFGAAGITPKFLILDDGWQPTEKALPGETRLMGFSANDKFPGGLGPTVEMCKSEFGIETFIVWHAMNGYWGGVDDAALPGYGTQAKPRQSSPGILSHMPDMDNYWGGLVGTVPPRHIARFFQDYHRHLRRQGVDGVKVDSQATLESVAYGLGGRVALMQRYHEALEGAVHAHFEGNLINCMSCASEMFYSAPASTLTRTSTDFWPNDPASHGAHLYANAQVGAWFGEFVHPDWDMFQSGHPMGAFHAAGRAVSGSPVYVSDHPESHDFDLLRKLVLPDGTVLRADLPGRPTPDCLFHDPTREDVLLKIFSRSREAGIVGVFNARYDKDQALPPIAGSVSPADVPGLSGSRCAVYAHSLGELRTLESGAAWALSLPPLSFEVFTLVPIPEHGVAPIGLADKFNSFGTVAEHGPVTGGYKIVLRGGGSLVVWCAAPPSVVRQNAASLPFTYNSESHLLRADVPAGGTVSIE